MGLFSNVFGEKGRVQPGKAELVTPYSAPKVAAVSAPPAPPQVSPEQFTDVHLESTGGGKGTVYGAVNSATGLPVAIKVFDKNLHLFADLKPNTYVGGVPFSTSTMPFEARVLQALAGIAYFPQLVGVGNQHDSRFNRQGVDFLVEEWVETADHETYETTLRVAPHEPLELLADAMFKAYERGFCFGDTEYRLQRSHTIKPLPDEAVRVPHINREPMWFSGNRISERIVIPRLIDVGSYLPTPEMAQLPKDLPPETWTVMSSTGPMIADFLRLAIHTFSKPLSGYNWETNRDWEADSSCYDSPHRLRQEIQRLEKDNSRDELNFDRNSHRYRALKTFEEMVLKSRAGEYGAFSDDSHARGGMKFGGILLPADVAKTAGDDARLESFIKDFSRYIYHLGNPPNSERLTVV